MHSSLSICLPHLFVNNQLPHSLFTRWSPLRSSKNHLTISCAIFSQSVFVFVVKVKCAIVKTRVSFILCTVCNIGPYDISQSLLGFKGCWWESVLHVSFSVVSEHINHHFWLNTINFGEGPYFVDFWRRVRQAEIKWSAMDRVIGIESWNVSVPHLRFADGYLILKNTRCVIIHILDVNCKCSGTRSAI